MRKRGIDTKLHQKLTRMQSLDELEHAVLEDLERRREAVTSGKPIGINTGLGTLDKLIGCLEAGVHVLAGEPGAGKTTFAVQLAVAAATSGYPALFVSFEESKDRLMLRTLCCWHNRKHGDEWVKHLDAKAFEDGQANDDDKRDFASACDEAEKGLWGKLWILEAPPRLDVAEVEDIAREAMGELKADRCLVVVDYLQQWALLRGGGDVIWTLVGELGQLALGLASPVLVVSVLDSPIEREAPLASFRDSGDIEYAAHTVLFLTADEKEDGALDDLAQAGVAARNVMLSLAKNRYGPTGSVRLRHYPDRCFFEQIA